MSKGPRFSQLADWLAWQQGLHPATIELGLDRVGRVLARTGWRKPSRPVITIGGTNGKGSCVALTASILRAAGYRVGSFTSPHLIDYRERICIDDEMVATAALIAAFERIADALDPDSLTYFEFNTLAALLVFEASAPDAIVLEVGMGGRLDSVNIVDADVAVVVSIGIDHAEFLGETTELIGYEKAGIFRNGRPAICGMTAPPASMTAHARQIGAKLLVRGRDFNDRPAANGTWDFVLDQRVAYHGLPPPKLPGPTQVHNAATVLMALHALAGRLQLTREAVAAGLRQAHVNGRFQRVADARGFEWVLDVAHNPAAASVLAANLTALPVPGRTLAVCGMLGDKDVAGVVRELDGGVNEWFAAATEGPRALDAAELTQRAAEAGITMTPAGTIAAAMTSAAAHARPGDRIVVFGSFHTVGPALALLGVTL